MKELYVLGGRQKRALLTQESDDEYLYESAVILEVDPETGGSKVCAEYRTPPQMRADAGASILFKAGALRGNTLYACTSTEVLVYKLPRFEPAGYVSLPCFNDLHHVCPTEGGSLLVANTGLDMVMEFTPQGQVLREWNVLGEDPWERFSRDVDYRKVISTKPHHSHPNHVFQFGEDIWVTRFFQKDALCLTRPTAPIAIDVEKPHDGHVSGDRIYFTTVDGHVVIVDRKTLRVSDVVDLKLIDNDCRTLLGWCRGLLVVDEAKVWVGFTRVRKTRFMENLNWAKHAFREVERATHVALYDLSARKCLQEIDLEVHGMNVVFSMFPAAKSARPGGALYEEIRAQSLAGCISWGL